MSGKGESTASSSGRGHGLPNFHQMSNLQAASEHQANGSIPQNPIPMPGNSSISGGDVEFAVASEKGDENAIGSSPGSPCSTLWSCSPVASPFGTTTCTSASVTSLEGEGTVTLTSSEADEDIECATILAEMSKGNMEKKRRVLRKTRSSARCEPSVFASSSLSLAQENLIPPEMIKVEPPSPPPNVGNLMPGLQRAALNAEEEDLPQLIRHKKFHYKARARTAPRPVPSVDDLKLSTYITREQAENRLRALGDLEETQREIDAFAAIICTGALYRMKIKEEVAESNGKFAELALPQASAVTSSVVLPSKNGPLVGSTMTVSKTTSVSLGSGGNVSMLNEPVAAMHGFAMPVASPGQASTSDDYEWISD